jgi:hypothetical protein
MRPAEKAGAHRKVISAGANALVKFSAAIALLRWPVFWFEHDSTLPKTFRLRFT